MDCVARGCVANAHRCALVTGSSQAQHGGLGHMLTHRTACARRAARCYAAVRESCGCSVLPSGLCARWDYFMGQRLKKKIESALSYACA